MDVATEGHLALSPGGAERSAGVSAPAVAPCTRSVHWGRWTAAAAAAALTFPICEAYRADITAARRRIATGGRVVKTAAGPIEYAEAGHGAPVLMIHGAGGGYDQGLWGFGDGLGEQDYRVIAPSRFGYLATPLPRDGSPAAQAGAHAALLDTLGVGRVAVMGASAGALSAMQFAIRYPQRTAALVLLVPDTWAPPAERSTEELMANQFIMNVVLKSDFIM